MNANDITPDSLPRMLADRQRRAAILSALRGEQGSVFPLHNRIAIIAPTCHATGDELNHLVDLLLDEDSGDDVLYSLIFHPAMPDRTLFRILDRGRCISALGHRRGPEHLLLRLAREQRYPEAILTLALHHYGPDIARRERFLSFVREHVELGWLRTSLRVSDAALKIPEERRTAALQLCDEYERLRRRSV